MTEELKTEAVEEAPQFEEQPQIESQEAQQEPPKRDASYNWEQARHALSAQQQKIEELERKLVETAKPQQEIDEFAGLDPDDYLTVSKAREFATKLASKEAEKIATRVVEERLKMREVADDETRMRAKYDDYDYVLENFAVPMFKNNPALAYQIQHSKNPAETAYKLGKMSDEYSEVGVKSVSPKAEKILKNTSRPVSSAAATTPLKSQADSFSKMSKQEIWEQSQKFARGA